MKKIRAKKRIKAVLILIILEYIYILLKIVLLIRWLSLNPYYTGIHLHVKSVQLKIELKRLNPYYTGIHLHNIWNGTMDLLSVLILIILEYIYIS